MRYYIIAGEASGDLHGSNLIKELKLVDSNAIFQGWGGELMQQQGMQLEKHYKDLAFMGFLEVVKNLGTIIKNFSIVKEDILHFKPDVVILIDYPGFNLRLAKWLKQQPYKVFYYISPQLWAWKESRVKQVKQYVDKMFCILPFEKEFYAKHQIEIDFVGHPLLDALANYDDEHNFIKQNNLDVNKKIIALLPGSRKQEISKTLPILLNTVAPLTQYQFIIAGLDYLEIDYYKNFNLPNNCLVVLNQTYSLLRHADAAIVTSGTATLETALFNVPQVVGYKGSWLSYQIGKRLVKVPFISLVNLVMGKKVVTELIQNDFSEENLLKELQQLLEENNRKEMLLKYEELREKLGGRGASKRTATMMYQYLQHN